MNKKTIIYLMLFLTIGIQAQTGTNGIYSSNSDPTINVVNPTIRKVVGGTIFNVKYEGSHFNSTIKSAFEHACKIWEEKIPSTYPINLTVKFASMTNTQCLATVNNIPVDTMRLYDSDRVYFKRYMMIESETFDVTVDEMKNTTDAIITFAINQPFDYSINPEIINPNKYDFVSVAIQAIGKALGFVLNAYESDGTIYKITPSNKYTHDLFVKQGGYGCQSFNYLSAISDGVYLTDVYNNNPFPLYSPQTYDPRSSLNSFSKDTNNLETLFMQPGIKKGNVVRYIGNGAKTFFSFCGWDYRLTTGHTDHVYEASTSNAIPFQGFSSNYNRVSTANLLNEEETIYDYLHNRNEFLAEGLYVLHKDGSWESFYSYGELQANSEYARSADGYLRIKYIWETIDRLGNRISNVEYILYDYIPQKPAAEVQGYTNSNYSLRSNRRPYTREVNTDDEYIDVEIGFKDVEGCTEILVEQTDSDYPVPYDYYINPGEGSFIAYMNKRYPSTLKLTYINANGQTIGEPFTIDLTSEITVEETETIEVNNDGKYLTYSINGLNNEDNKEMSYKISNIVNPNQNMIEGKLNSTNGKIDISNLQKGIYALSISKGKKKYTTKWSKSL